MKRNIDLREARTPATFQIILERRIAHFLGRLRATSLINQQAELHGRLAELRAMLAAVKALNQKARAVA